MALKINIWCSCCSSHMIQNTILCSMEVVLILIESKTTKVHHSVHRGVFLRHWVEMFSLCTFMARKHRWVSRVPTLSPVFHSFSHMILIPLSSFHCFSYDRLSLSSCLLCRRWVGTVVLCWERSGEKRLGYFIAVGSVLTMLWSLWNLESLES